MFQLFRARCRLIDTKVETRFALCRHSPWYLDDIAEGKIEPAARPLVKMDKPSAALIDGNRGRGAAAIGLAGASRTGPIGRYSDTGTWRPALTQSITTIVLKRWMLGFSMKKRLVKTS